MPHFCLVGTRNENEAHSSHLGVQFRIMFLTCTIRQNTNMQLHMRTAGRPAFQRHSPLGQYHMNQSSRSRCQRNSALTHPQFRPVTPQRIFRGWGEGGQLVTSQQCVCVAGQATCMFASTRGITSFRHARTYLQSARF